VTTTRRWVALLLIAGAASAAIAARDLRIDNRLERWQGDDEAGALLYERFRQLFGSDEFVLMAVSGPTVLEADSLEQMLDAAERLETVPGVARVRGVPIVYRELFGAEDPDALADELRATPFYRGLLVGNDADTVGILLEVDPPEDAFARRRIMTEVRAASAGLEEHGLRVELVGSTVLIVTLDEMSEREVRRLFPVALVLSLSVLALLLRSLRAMVVAAACAGLGVVLTLGLMAVSGRSLDMISSVLPSLVWVLALSNSVHLLRRYQDRRLDHDAKQALDQTLVELTRPCTMASLTTALGFLSLVTATMAPVRELGLVAAAGLVFSLAVNLSVGPLLIELLRVPAGRARLALPLGSFAAWVSGRAVPVLVASLCIVILTVAAIGRVRVESNPLEFLPDDSETVRAYSWVGERLSGFYTLELVVRLEAEWWSRDSVAILDALYRELDESEIVVRVLTPLDLLRQLNYWDSGFDPAAYRIPPDTVRSEELIRGADERGRAELASLATEDGLEVRLSAIVNQMDESSFLELVETARSAVRQLPPGVEGDVTGAVVQLVEAQQQLVRTQLRSFGLAFAIVFAAIRLGLGSWRLTLLSVLPNLLPIAASFGCMAMLGIPLDAATVMVASVALGIAVDDTVHFLEGYRRRLHDRGEAGTALRSTITEVGPALVVTTAAACVGFFSFAASSFVPLRYFGLLGGIALLVAVGADLVVVPAMLVCRERLKGSRSGVIE
jgi:predicted RND superfamily exporter protein